MNANLFDPFSYFKLTYKKELNRNKRVLLEDLISMTQMEFQGLSHELRQQCRQWYEQVYEMKYLENLLVSSQTEEIIIHHPKVVEVIQRKGRNQLSLDIEEEDLMLSLESLALRANQNWSHAHPFTSFPYKMGTTETRMTLLHPCLSTNKSPKLFVRTSLPSPNLDELNYVSSSLIILREAIVQRKNILISGATSSGKTTLLKAMLRECADNEHLLLIEDTPEIQSTLKKTTHLVADEDHPQKSLAQYCKYALRLRPDRIVLGEMRGEEVISFLLCLNTGHQGMLTTLHANSARDALSRVATLFFLYHAKEGLSYEQLMKMICQNIDLVVHMNKGQIKEVIEVLGVEQGHPYTRSLIPQEAELRRWA